MVDYDSERMELSTRDIVAIANYTEIIEGDLRQMVAFILISVINKEFILSKFLKFTDNL